MSASDTVSDFMNLSAALTGFDRIDLEGTGLADTYYNEVRRIVGGRIFGRLLIRWHQIDKDAAGNENKRDKELKRRILNSKLLGDVARNIISLWYVGNWNQMPLLWRHEYGASATDQTHVVSAAAFREGLVWRAIDAHPPTAKAPGFGTWAFPPEGAEPLDESDVAWLEARGIVNVALESSKSKQPSTSKKKKQSRTKGGSRKDSKH